MVKSTYWSCRPGFDSQFPHGSSKPSVTLVLGDLTPPSGFRSHQEGKWYICIHAGQTLMPNYFGKQRTCWVGWLRSLEEENQ